MRKESELGVRKFSVVSFANSPKDTQEEVLAVARSRAEGLEGLVVAIERKAGEEGKLFGSVGAGDVAEAITAAGVEVQRAEVRLPEPVLRQVVDYEVTIALHARAHAKVTVQVVAG